MNFCLSGKFALTRSKIIEAISAAGSFLDGGAPHPIQEAARTAQVWETDGHHDRS